MKVELLVASIAGSITAFGWFVNHVLKTRYEQKRERLREQLEHTNRQLEKLYGPLVFLILEGRKTWNDLLDVLGRDIVFEGDTPLPEDELKIWLFWVENDFLPRNRKIRDLLESNTHLIEGHEMPQSYLDFIDHESSWRNQTSQMETRGGELQLDFNHKLVARFRTRGSSVF